MDRFLLDFLACPRCRGALTPTADAGEGELRCEQGCGTYPIENGVPRLLPELCDASGQRGDFQQAARRSFGAQWKMFKYGGTTWGVREEERVQVALHELGWSEADVAGKVILDAGCGNGTLSNALARRGATVIAADLADSIFRAREHCRNPGVHFVQANLFFPPFRRSAFDAVYSCGVFHHTPDTRRCFDALVPTLKDDARSRYFVWLYAPRSPLFNLTVEPLMKLTRRLPSRVLAPACLGLAPFVEAASRLLTRLGVLGYSPRTLRDRAIQLHDLLSPPFVWYHRTDEVRHWANAAGLHAVEETDYAPDGEVPGRLRAILDHYRGVCRPGFGLLCRHEQTPLASR